MGMGMTHCRLGVNAQRHARVMLAGLRALSLRHRLVVNLITASPSACGNHFTSSQDVGNQVLSLLRILLSVLPARQ